MAIIVKDNGGLILGAKEAAALYRVLAQVDHEVCASLGISDADMNVSLDIYGAIHDAREEMA